MTQAPDLSLVKAGSGSTPAKMDEEPITIRSLPDDVMAIVFREIVNLNSGELSEIAKCRLVSKCFRLLMHNSVHNYGSSIVKIRMLSPVFPNAFKKLLPALDSKSLTTEDMKKIIGEFYGAFQREMTKLHITPNHPDFFLCVKFMHVALEKHLNKHRPSAPFYPEKYLHEYKLNVLLHVINFLDSQQLTFNESIIAFVGRKELREFLGGDFLLNFREMADSFAHQSFEKILPESYTGLVNFVSYLVIDEMSCAVKNKEISSIPSHYNFESLSNQIDGELRTEIWTIHSKKLLSICPKIIDKEAKMSGEKHRELSNFGETEELSNLLHFDFETLEDFYLHLCISYDPSFYFWRN